MTKSMHGLSRFLTTAIAVSMAFGAGAGTIRLDGAWIGATDPKDDGVANGWPSQPPAETVVARIPGFQSDTFPALRDEVTWFWTTFELPETNAFREAALSTGLATYISDWWVNGVKVGRCEGRGLFEEYPCTKALRKGRNTVALRLAMPGGTNRVDGVSRRDMVAMGDGVVGTFSWSGGGVFYPVEIVLRGDVRAEKPVVRADWQTGRVTAAYRLHNGRGTPVPLRMVATVTDTKGETVFARTFDCTAMPGDKDESMTFDVLQHRLWSVDEPNLYTLSFLAEPGTGVLQRTDVTFGFRDFRVSPDGWFTLNGKRLLVKGGSMVAGIGTMGAVTRPELVRKEIWQAKSAGFNTIRLHFTTAWPEMVDLCDRIGLLVICSHGASWLERRATPVSPNLKDDFRRHLLAEVEHKINHPAVVAWEMQNETLLDEVHQWCRDALQPLRDKDPTRLVFIGSGRFDSDVALGSVSNPGSRKWECLWGVEGENVPWKENRGEEERQFFEKRFWGAPDSPFPARPDRGPYGDVIVAWDSRRGDVHAYFRTPLQEASQYVLRRTGRGTKPFFVSEFGVNGVSRGGLLARQFEQDGFGGVSNTPANAHREMGALLDDLWQTTGLADLYANTETFTRETFRQAAATRGKMIDCLRSNPQMCGFSVASLSGWANGLSVMNFYRDFYPYLHDVLEEKMAPLHWCLFLENDCIEAGGEASLEVVLANEDVLAPGRYPVRARVVSKEHGCVWNFCTNLTVQAVAPPMRFPLAQLVFKERFLVAKPGDYECSVECEKGAIPTGGTLTLRVTEPAHAAPGTRVETVGFTDAENAWLATHGVELAATGSAKRILVGRTVLSDAAWSNLAVRAEAGTTVVVLDPETLTWRPDAPRKPIDRVNRFPLQRRFPKLPEDLTVRLLVNWAYRAFAVIRPDALTAGLPAGVCDDRYFAQSYPCCLYETKEPGRIVSFATGLPATWGDEMHGFDFGVTLGVWRYGKGRIVLNAYRVFEGKYAKDPYAGRLLLNMAHGAVD
ncbi:MAG: hypothetical protein IJG84_16065 [Kiritimatiellae bacterium]|nr:hypothetical protein [Kiritimatiellia bacterium]